MGLCTRDCQDDCCNNKCVSRFRNTGHGSCVDAFNMILCLCSYSRWIHKYVLCCDFYFMF
jgi:hypothetical protein